MTQAQRGLGHAALAVDDVVNFLSTYEGRPFDITVTSPPYGLEKAYAGVDDAWAWDDYRDWVVRWAGLLLDCTEEHGRLCLNVPLDSNKLGHLPFAAEMSLLLQHAVGWRYETTLIWDKGVTTSRTAYGSWLSPNAPNLVIPAEAVLVFSKGDWNRGGANGRTSLLTKAEFLEWRSSVWAIKPESAKRAGHPAPYPEELVRRLLKLFAFQEDLAFDPFLGSGTTCAVAQQLGIASLGVDQSAEYVELARTRLAKIVAEQQGAVVDSSWRTWVNAVLPTETLTVPSAAH